MIKKFQKLINRKVAKIGYFSCIYFHKKFLKNKISVKRINAEKDRLYINIKFFMCGSF